MNCAWLCMTAEQPTVFTTNVTLNFDPPLCEPKKSRKVEQPIVLTTNVHLNLKPPLCEPEGRCRKVGQPTVFTTNIPLNLEPPLCEPEERHECWTADFVHNRYSSKFRPLVVWTRREVHEGWTANCVHQNQDYLTFAVPCCVNQKRGAWRLNSQLCS